tara:strand:- start:5795 stop:5938 length:144 start_codon:yes stop_codon:yes gene_type:complete
MTLVAGVSNFEALVNAVDYEAAERCHRRHGNNPHTGMNQRRENGMLK